MRIRMIIIAMVMIIATNAVWAGFRVANVFQDHMVLQREMPVKIWGFGDDGADVTLTFDGQTVTGKVAEGKWMVALQPMKANSKPQELKARSGGTEVVLKDVLVGEVWVLGGQSNMQKPPLKLWFKGKSVDVIKSFDRPLIRINPIACKGARTPQEDVGKGGKESWGKLQPGDWTVISTDHNIKHISSVPYFFARELQDQLKVPVGILNVCWGGAQIETFIAEDDLRTLPEAKAMFDYWHPLADNYMSEESQQKRAAESKAALARAEQMLARAKEQNNSKQIGKWTKRCKEIKASTENPPKAYAYRQSFPAACYNQMIYPIRHVAARGALFYQGENNALAGRPRIYQNLYPMLIACWRKTFSCPDWPFGIIQIGYWGKTSGNTHAFVREAHLNAYKTIPNTGFISTMDDSGDIHPVKKEPIGKRAAMWACESVYKLTQKTPWLGAIYDRFEVKENRIVIHFRPGLGKLSVKGGGELKGFMIAGADKNFVPARAEIKGLTVEVWSDQVAAPVAARYAFVNVPSEANLAGDGWLASCFRTDNWDPPADNPFGQKAGENDESE